jgi:Zn-dependent protease with chaperone function
LSRPLRGQSLLVVVVGAGFWLVALAMVALLVAVGVGILEYAPDSVLGSFGAFGLAGALVLGLIPPLSRSRDKEEATPPLDPEEHPRLRALIVDVAASVGTSAPDALYVFHGANAFAGARRPRAFASKVSEVGIGLPMLAALTCDETRAVVAHEMGHHVAGDVRLGPWIRKTRLATLRAASRLEGSSFWLHLPFVAYADLFAKISTRVSRAQELSADAMSARIVGAPATASALRKIERLSLVWDTYFETEVIPILSRGHNPPLLEGFERYREAALVDKSPAFEALAVARAHAAAPRQDDTHPPLEERLLALGEASPLSMKGETALSLLDDVAREEDRVLRLLVRAERQESLKAVPWSAVADDVWLPMWKETVAAHAKALTRLAPLRRIPDALRGWEELAAATRTGPAILSPGAERRRVNGLVSVWLAVTLAEGGFRIEAPPGLAVRAEKGASVVYPFELVNAVASGSVDATEWAKKCDEWGL